MSNFDMDERQAWRDFYDVVRPDIWPGLGFKDRRDVNTAERDYHGRRKNRHGAVIRLGADRVERLLERLAPGRYVVERTVVFRRATPPPAPPPKGGGT